MYLLAVINSFLINKYYRAYYTDVNVKPTYLAQLPIPNISINRQKLFIDIVDEIHTLKSKNEPTFDLEKKIDNLVYKLYDLTYEEIKVVDPGFELSEQQYKDVII